MSKRKTMPKRGDTIFHCGHILKDSMDVFAIPLTTLRFKEGMITSKWLIVCKDCQTDDALVCKGHDILKVDL